MSRYRKLLPGMADRPINLDTLTPRQIVAELDKYVVGQQKAKRAVAIALRNRVRRQQLPPDMAEEVAPKNIILIGPTGVGKTEIARRLARLSHSPFLKVEASKFTEVGYVGRDVESMVRDLVELAVDMVQSEMAREVAEKAVAAAEERMLDLLLAPPHRPHKSRLEEPGDWAAYDNFLKSRERMREMLRAGELDHRQVELEVKETRFPSLEIFSSSGVEELGVNVKDMLGGMFGGQKKRRQLPVAEAMDYLVEEEEGRLIDKEKVARDAIRRVEHSGILFLDEIDKIAGREGGHGPDVSREGVQRDILPIVEGTTVHTKYGMVRTDHILFIAAGAFHVSAPSDLIPELQGRFPIRVELEPLGEEDFRRILTEPENALTRQYQALLATEEVQVEFREDGVDELARVAQKVNQQTENIGARRLHTILERVLEDISFEAPEQSGRSLVVDRAYVQSQLQDILQNQDLSRFIL